MKIIIDAYNFLKQVLHTNFISEKQTNKWIKTFLSYAKLRGNKVVLAFDAGPSFYQSTDDFGQVVVMYSGQHQSADDLIKSLLQAERGKNILLVTSDREICEFADTLDIVSIGSKDFYKIFNQVLQQQQQSNVTLVGNLYKISQIENNELDLLMEEGSRMLDQSHREATDLALPRLSSDKKNSKMNKRLIRKIEKI